MLLEKSREEKEEERKGEKTSRNKRRDEARQERNEGERKGGMKGKLENSQLSTWSKIRESIFFSVASCVRPRPQEKQYGSL